MNCLDRLVRERRITLAHVRVLEKWGERHFSPSARHPSEASERRLWDEALVWLESALRSRGIVA